MGNKQYFNKTKPRHHTGVYLDKGLYQSAVELAKAHGVSVNQALNDLIRLGLERIAEVEGATNDN